MYRKLVLLMLAILLFACKSEAVKEDVKETVQRFPYNYSDGNTSEIYFINQSNLDIEVNEEVLHLIVNLIGSGGGKIPPQLEMVFVGSYPSGQVNTPAPATSLVYDDVSFVSLNMLLSQEFAIPGWTDEDLLNAVVAAELCNQLLHEGGYRGHDLNCNSLGIAFIEAVKDEDYETYIHLLGGVVQYGLGEEEAKLPPYSVQNYHFMVNAFRNQPLLTISD